MQKSFNEDFDLQVRSIMEEAQEPAPAGAWEAISARLDAMAAATAASAASASGSAAARGARRVWYWAGAALAMAAAVALGVFFTGTSENNSNLIDSRGLPTGLRYAKRPDSHTECSKTSLRYAKHPCFAYGDR